MSMLLTALNMPIVLVALSYATRVAREDSLLEKVKSHDAVCGYVRRTNVSLEKYAHYKVLIEAAMSLKKIKISFYITIKNLRGCLKEDYVIRVAYAV